ncbi:uncharacterized protein LOC114523210 [Dendronephthya gigantea]|uniref:uncharacterized protein LOC114523210 n=1 Tax=Dendronephthya gigantea TaxID=151771 RepID=UPI00106BF5EB|nr:uncharacterized protein LOC114523210 [Dendronephthya gigantea]
MRSSRRASLSIYSIWWSIKKCFCLQKDRKLLALQARKEGSIQTNSFVTWWITKSLLENLLQSFTIKSPARNEVKGDLKTTRLVAIEGGQQDRSSARLKIVRRRRVRR